MSVVFDTNVLISATLWHGSVAQKLLAKLIQTNTKIFSSTEILSEYQKVLIRDFDYAGQELVYIMEKVLAVVTLVKPVQKVIAVEKDPDDNKIIECALAAASNYIITYDKHLLNIGQFDGIEIITPELALKII